MRTIIIATALAALLSLPAAAGAMMALEPDGAPTPVVKSGKPGTPPPGVTPPDGPPSPSDGSQIQKHSGDGGGRLIIRTGPRGEKKNGAKAPAGGAAQ